MHIIRKQYLDGSIPAGFQRTSIIGVDGWIPYKDRRIGIIQLAIEEDACREISDVGHRRIYATDRLAMPLIEVVTAPEMYTPQEAYEVGVQIDKLLKSTGKIRRGIGRVRQDVNVSVTGGTRIEIKGVPRLPLIPNLVFHEAFRQTRLLQLRDEIATRGINADNFRAEVFDLSEVLSNETINKQLKPDWKIGAILLKNMQGLLTHPLGPNRSFASDIAGRLRVIACITSDPVFIHTDDLENSGLTEQDIISAAFDIKAASGQTAVEIRRLAKKALQELGLEDDDKANFFTGFNTQGRPVRTGLLAGAPEAG